MVKRTASSSSFPSPRKGKERTKGKPERAVTEGAGADNGSMFSTTSSEAGGSSGAVLEKRPQPIPAFEDDMAAEDGRGATPTPAVPGLGETPETTGVIAAGAVPAPTIPSVAPAPTEPAGAPMAAAAA